SNTRRRRLPRGLRKGRQHTPDSRERSHAGRHTAARSGAARRRPAGRRAHRASRTIPVCATARPAESPGTDALAARPCARVRWHRPMRDRVWRDRARARRPLRSACTCFLGCRPRESSGGDPCTPQDIAHPRAAQSVASRGYPRPLPTFFRMHHFTRSLLALSFAVSLAAGDRLYTVTSNDATLRLVNPFTGTTISSVPITSSAGQVNWANGLAVHPLTGALWAILYVSGSGRVLARLDPTTGIATVVGPTGRAFAGIAFAANGTLYGVTGDGDQVAPETLFTLNLQTGAPTQVLALGNGDDGETIGFDPVTGNLLHASGYFSPVLERIDLGSLTVTSVPTSGSPYIEALAITHWVGSNFLMSDINDDLFVVSADGVVSKIATLDHSFIKGLAFVQTTNAAFFQ